MIQIILAVLTSYAVAKSPGAKSYRGIAKNNGQQIYVEQHKVTYNSNGDVKTAVTDYVLPNGKVTARLASDFKDSLTAPAHKLENFENGNVQGIRWVDSSLIMFDQDKGQPERTKTMSSDESRGRLLVGCQGLNYYILKNMDKLEKLNKVPISLLMPGKLDFYDFEMRLMDENPEGILNFKITIESFFLKLFAPKLLVKYDLKKQRMIWYQGISNILDDDGDPLKVAIDFVYD